MDGLFNSNHLSKVRVFLSIIFIFSFMTIWKINPEKQLSHYIAKPYSNRKPTIIMKIKLNICVDKKDFLKKGQFGLMV